MCNRSYLCLWDRITEIEKEEGEKGKGEEGQAEGPREERKRESGRKSEEGEKVSVDNGREKPRQRGERREQ